MQLVKSAVAGENEFTRNIYEFHTKFGLAYDGPPRDLPPDLLLFRTKFMAEELCEYVGTPKVVKQLIQSALEKPCRILQPGPETRAMQLDALVDLMYVLLGAAHLHGFDICEAWRRVHEANMKKERCLRPSDSARGSTYDVIKPAGWRPADLSDLV